MPPNRFVILHHLAPTGEHWDLMLEREHALTTWQLQGDPSAGSACPIRGVHIKDHRKLYLDYEGPIGGGRGIVSRVDQGRYELLAANDDSWTFRLAGQRLRGDFRLVRPDPDSPSDWTLEAM